MGRGTTRRSASHSNFGGGADRTSTTVSDDYSMLQKQKIEEEKAVKNKQEKGKIS